MFLISSNKKLVCKQTADGALLPWEYKVRATSKAMMVKLPSEFLGVGEALPYIPAEVISVMGQKCITLQPPASGAAAPKRDAQKKAPPCNNCPPSLTGPHRLVTRHHYPAVTSPTPEGDLPAVSAGAALSIKVQPQRTSKR